MTLRVNWENFDKENEALLNEVYKFPILCRNVIVELNDYTLADKFSCEIDYKSFPFDPRTIRSCGVSVHIEDQKRIFRGNSLDILKPTEANTVFQGFADEESISFDNENRIVRMEGRDFTSLFADVKYTGGPISLSKTVDELINDLIQDQEATKQIQINNKTGDILPILSELAANLESTSATISPKRNESYWDVIQKIINRAGLIGYIELDKFVISKPQKLFDREKAKQFIYGRNVQSLSFKRKLGRHKGFNVRVVSVNLDEKTIVEAKIPEEATNPNIKSPRVSIIQLDSKGKKIEPPKDAPFMTFKIPDIANKDHLIKVGEKIFEELSRQQIEGQISTLEMEIPEITKKSEDNVVSQTKPVSFNTIRNGTPILITMEMDDLEKIRTISTLAERRKFLILRGYEPNIAAAFASSMNRISTPFYTKSVKFTIDKESGFNMDLDFINFIELDNKDMTL